MTATPLTANIQSRLKDSSLIMATPDFVTLAGEFLRNNEGLLHQDTVGFLATRIENDTKVT